MFLEFDPNLKTVPGRNLVTDWSLYF